MEGRTISGHSTFQRSCFALALLNCAHFLLPSPVFPRVRALR